MTDKVDDGYIGCGVFTQRDARSNLLFHKAVRKYGYNTFTRHILSFHDTYQEALDDERYMVNSLWVKDKNNYNAAIGGEGNTTSWMSDERKAKWVAKIRGKIVEFYKNGGREKLMEGLKNGKKPRNFGPKNGSYNKPHVRRRVVIQYSKDNIIIKEYEYLMQAARELNLPVSNIHNCCMDKHKTCGGFVFRFTSYSKKEKEIFDKNNNRLSKEEYNSRRLDKVRQSFLEKGNKRSLQIINENTKEVIYGVSNLIRRQTINDCARTVKKKLLSGLYYGEWKLK